MSHGFRKIAAYFIRRWDTEFVGKSRSHIGFMDNRRDMCRFGSIDNRYSQSMRQGEVRPFSFRYQRICTIWIHQKRTKGSLCSCGYCHITSRRQRHLWAPGPRKNVNWYEVFMLAEYLEVPRKVIAKQRGISLSTVDLHLRRKPLRTKHCFRPSIPFMKIVHPSPQPWTAASRLIPLKPLSVWLT